MIRRNRSGPPLSSRKLPLKSPQEKLAIPEEDDMRCHRRHLRSAGPKRGSLNVGAWNPQESGRKAPRPWNAAFSMLHCSSLLVAAQLLVKITSALRKSECCSATSAAQHRKLQHKFRFRLWHVAGVGFRGVGFRTYWWNIFKPLYRRREHPLFLGNTPIKVSQSPITLSIFYGYF